VLAQLTLEELDRRYPSFADKILVTRTQLQCSACHVYVKAKQFTCPHCGIQFVTGGP